MPHFNKSLHKTIGGHVQSDKRLIQTHPSCKLTKWIFTNFLYSFYPRM